MMIRDEDIDSLPGPKEFKEGLRKVNEKIRDAASSKPRPFGKHDPFEEEYKYRNYLRECGFDVPEFMTPGQIAKADEQEATIKKGKEDEAARQRALEWQRRLMAANIPEMHRECTFENYEITEAIQRTFVDQLRTDKRNWFVFCGNTGTGKNHLAAAMIKERLREGRTAVLWKVKRLMDEQLARSGVEKMQMLRELEAVDLLVLNELGRSSEKKFFQDTIFDLLDERHENNKQTVLISNLSKDDIFNLFADGPMQRRLSYSNIFQFTWGHYTKRGEAPLLFPTTKEAKV